MNIHFLILIFSLITISNVQATNLSDTITYADMYNFLVSQELDSPKIKNEESVRSKLFIFNILDSKCVNTDINFHTPIGIYKFYFLCDDCDYYVLIKINDCFYIYKERNLNDILCKLLEIKKEYPFLLSDELFIMYLEKLVIKDSNSLIKRYGSLNYIFNWHDK